MSGFRFVFQNLTIAGYFPYILSIAIFSHILSSMGSHLGFGWGCPAPPLDSKWYKGPKGVETIHFAKFCQKIGVEIRHFPHFPSNIGISNFILKQYLTISRGPGTASLFLTWHCKAGIRKRPRALGAWGFIGITCRVTGCCWRDSRA